MKAFHNDEALKQKYLDRIETHRIADELIKGKGWDGGKGCAIGCTFENYDHFLMEKEWDVPQMLAQFEDVIFEGLPNEESQEWPERFTSAIKVGSDLSKVGPKFLLAILTRCRDQLDQNGIEIVGDAVNQAIKVLYDWVEFGKVDTKAAARAARAVMAAAEAEEAEEAEVAAAYKWLAEKLVKLIGDCR